MKTTKASLNLLEADLVVGIKRSFKHFNKQFKESKRKQPHSKVTEWRSRGAWLSCGYSKTSYTFTGLPNVDRVIRETLDEGAVGVRIECDEEFESDIVVTTQNVYIYNSDIDYLGWSIGKYLGWHADTGKNTSLESAIKSYCKEQSSKHPELKYRVGDKLQWTVGKQAVSVRCVNKDKSYDIETAEGKLYHCRESSLSPPPDMQIGDTFKLHGVKMEIIAHDDERRASQDEYWYDASVGNKWHKTDDGCIFSNDVYKAIPVDDIHIGKEWVLEQAGNPWDGMRVKCVRKDTKFSEHEQVKGFSDSGLLYPEWQTKIIIPHFIINCIDPAFWTGEILGEPVRCYEDEKGAFRFLSKSDHHIPFGLELGLWLSAIKNANIPIMPYSQSNGQYDPPTISKMETTEGE